jgi:hypothetical protein
MNERPQQPPAGEDAESATAVARATVPAEALGYGGADVSDPWRRVTRGIAWVAVLIGAALAVRDGLRLVGWLGGWSDPFMFRINQPGGVGGLPPSPWLVAASLGSLASAVLWAAGGAAWLTGRRPWARRALAAGAAIALPFAICSSALWTTYNTIMPIGRGGGMTPANAAFEVAPLVAGVAAPLAFPALLLVLALRREPWR